jgi:hypothetical protein
MAPDVPPAAAGVLAGVGPGRKAPGVTASAAAVGVLAGWGPVRRVAAVVSV